MSSAQDAHDAHFAHEELHGERHLGGHRHVDEILPIGKLVTLGFQHVLVMYAGAVAVPLIIGGALNLPKEQVACLINADLFACGIATLIQSVGLWRFGIRLPVMMGVTFAAVGPMMAIGGNPEPRHSRRSTARSSLPGVFAHPGRAVHSRFLPLFPAGRHRHRDRGDRDLADAGRGELGGRRHSAHPTSAIRIILPWR